MKQKIVVKVSMDNKKSRSKALKTVAGLSGVESAALIGANKDQIQVIGEGIDSVELTQLLRKKVGYTELVSVGEDKKEEAKSPARMEAPAIEESVIGWYHQPHVYGYPNHYVEVRATDPGCIIM